VEFHRQHGAKLTVAAHQHPVKIDLGRAIGRSQKTPITWAWASMSTSLVHCSSLSAENI